MADVKISGLPAATTPLAGSEVLPIVQSSTTKKVSVDNLTAGKAVSALSMTATNLKTSPATANLDISGTTIAASGSDANVDVNINAKGSGVAYLNQRWGVNQSGTLVTSAGNTYDIGNGTNNPRDINADRTVFAQTFDTNVVAAGVTLSGTTLSADGTNTNIDINLTPKGTGEVNITKADIDSGSIDGTTIGGASPAAGTFTTVTTTSDVQVGNNTDNNAKILRLLTNITTNDFAYMAFRNVETSNTDGVRLLATQPAASTAYFDFAVVCNDANVLRERLRVKGQTGNVEVTGGNLVIGTSGKGIDFSVTSEGTGTMTSELFSDYEEGTFTPTIASGATSISYTTQSGFYTKIGRVVQVQINLNISTSTLDANQLQLGGLPFTCGANYGGFYMVFANSSFENSTTAPRALWRAESGSTVVKAYFTNAATYKGTDMSGANPVICLVGSYIV